VTCVELQSPRKPSPACRNMLALESARDQRWDGASGQMRKINYKALMAILTVGRRSRKHIDWTLAIAIFSTMVTVGLVLLYVWQGRPDLR
jgi:hypothetical protein